MLHISAATKRILALGGVIALIGVIIVVQFLWGQGNNVGYSPTQPIPYSHKLHAGDNQIPCLYCHANADNSKHATIPSLNICMNCHVVVKTDSPKIQKLTEAYKNNTPIEWIKVHDLPDYVFFNHRAHVLKGVDCANCHGDVKSMEKIEQVKTLQMGFCVNCHRENKAPTDCSTCHN